MKNNIEIEYKTLLDETEYKRLKNHYLSFPSVTQKNTYYDTADRQLARQNISLRIREIAKAFTLTIKIPKNNLQREIECPLSANSVSAIFASPAENLISEYCSDKLEVLGTLETERVSIPLARAILCLDKNFYLSLIDYELEYELLPGISEDSASYHKLLKEFGISEKKAKGKFFRFIQALDNDI